MSRADAEIHEKDDGEIPVTIGVLVSELSKIQIIRNIQQSTIRKTKFQKSFRHSTSILVSTHWKFDEENDAENHKTLGLIRR